MSRRNGSHRQSETPTHKEDPIITPTEVGKMIGKSRATVISWIKDGLMEAIRFPGEPGRFGVRTSEALKLLQNSALAEKVQTDGNS